jgi:hypothetical protein
MRRIDELWVEVPLTDGQVLIGMLRLRDEERIVLRHAHWVWLSQDGPVHEYLQTDVPWRDCAEIDAAEALGVFSVSNDFDQKWDIVSFPPVKREQNKRWSTKHWRPFSWRTKQPRTVEDALAAGWAED